MIGRQQQVVRFDVAVYDSLAVRVGQSFGHLTEIVQREAKVERPLAAQVEQIAARHVFEHQEMKRHAS